MALGVDWTGAGLCMHAGAGGRVQPLHGVAARSASFRRGVDEEASDTGLCCSCFSMVHTCSQATALAGCLAAQHAVGTTVARACVAILKVALWLQAALIDVLCTVLGHHHNTCVQLIAIS